MRKHSYVHTEDQFSVLSHQMWLLNVIVNCHQVKIVENNCLVHSGSVSLMVYVESVCNHSMVILSCFFLQ